MTALLDPVVEAGPSKPSRGTSGPRLGLIARADDGGLGTQTWEAHRHLNPAATLVVDCGTYGRGRARPERFEHGKVWLARGPAVDRRDFRGFLEDVDVIFTAETFYCREFALLAQSAGVRTVIQANPELWRGDEEAADVVVVPTHWERDRIPGALELPVPVAGDRYTPKHVEQVRTLYHPAAPAMLDRNGTALVLDALPFVTQPVELIIRDYRTQEARSWTVENVEVTCLPTHDGPYWEALPEEADALLLPRRYGGLCLPMQEAAARGLPVLSLDVEPQRSWPFVFTVEPTVAHAQVPMRGGHFDVQACNPRDLAAAIDQLALEPGLAAGLSQAAGEWARSHSWGRLLPRYQEVLGA